MEKILRVGTQKGRHDRNISSPIVMIFMSLDIKNMINFSHKVNIYVDLSNYEFLVNAQIRVQVPFPSHHPVCSKST